MPGLLMREAARRVAGAGVKGDTIAAHMDPAKAALLKAAGGAGKRNLRTGLLQYYDASAGNGGEGDEASGAGGGPNDGSPAGDGGGVMGGADPMGTDGSPAADGTGAYGGGAPTGSTGPAAAAPSAGGNLVDAVSRAIGERAKNPSLTDIAGVIGGTPGAVAANVAHGIAEGVGAVTGAITEGLGGVPSTDSTVGDGVSGGEGEQAPAAASGAAANRGDNYRLPASKGLLARQAERLQAEGRAGDTILAHINPREAQLLLKAGGSGTVNPKTGLLEFANQSNFDSDLYLRNNPDVAAAGVDPWQHYQQFGQNEGRAATAEEVSARQEGYTGLFGKPESGDTYVDWKSRQSASSGGGSSGGGAGGGTSSGVSGPDQPTVTAPDEPSDWGTRPGLNHQLWGYLQEKGYDPEFTGFGGQISDNFGNWLAKQSGETRSDIEAWLDANDPNRRPSATTTVAGGVMAPPKTTEQRVADILQAESPLMRRAASQGLMLANRRGLLNSSVAAEAAQAAMIDAAVPIASNDAGLENQRWLQQQDIANQRGMQQTEIAAKNWQSQLDADTRTRIANMQVATADRDKIGTMVANIQAQHTSRINNIVSNPDIPAETRAQYITDADTWMRNQLDMLEGMYGVQLDWAA